MISLRRRLMMLNKVSVDVQALTFSYTGTWTDTEMAINGAQYRVLQLKSAGTLTLDPRMVGVVPFDVWVVRQGDTGSSSGTATSCSTQQGHGIIMNGEYSCNGTYTYCQGSPGSAGANGGWSMFTGVISSNGTLAASVGSPAYLGDIASVSGTTRSGSAWFDLPSGNTGAGGAGGAAPWSQSCTACSASGGQPGPNPGGAGSPGIVVIRIPIES